MGHIIVKDLQKSYKVAYRREGMSASIKQFIKPNHKIIHALSQINFEIEPGELVGCIGPNGAGKSTTVKIMSGILVPDAGHCTINNIIPWKERKKHVKDIGVVFGQRSQLWWDVPVIDSFEILKDIYKVPIEFYNKRKGELIERLDLSEIIGTPVRQLSLGQRMRCELAASLLHNPSTLFLDEPTIGLDAISKLAVRQFIKDINKDYNTTVILTTHDMDDIEALCNRTMIIGSGRILYDGNISGLRQMVTDERRIRIEFRSLPHGLKDLSKDLTVINKEGLNAEFGYNPDAVDVSILITKLANQYAIKDIFVENASIEEIIADLYGVLDI